MGMLLNILGAPVIAPIKLAKWIGEKVQEVAQQEMGDETSVKAELLELQIKLELAEISQSDYDKKEKELLQKLNAQKGTRS